VFTATASVGWGCRLAERARRLRVGRHRPPPTGGPHHAPVRAPHPRPARDYPGFRPRRSRIKVEYKLSRAIALRVVGQYSARSRYRSRTG
jgi:hypothetical protein